MRHLYLTIILSAIVACLPMNAHAQNDSTSSSTYMLMPLIFDKQQPVATPGGASSSKQGLKVDNDWIGKAQQRWLRVHDMRYQMMIDNPTNLPPVGEIASMEEPFVHATIYTPQEAEGISLSWSVKFSFDTARIWSVRSMFA